MVSCQLPGFGCCCAVSHFYLLSHVDHSKCLQAPRGHQKTVTSDLVHPRCFRRAVCLWFSLCQFSCLYLPLSFCCLFWTDQCILMFFIFPDIDTQMQSQQQNLAFVNTEKHIKGLRKALACLHITFNEMWKMCVPGSKVKALFSTCICLYTICLWLMLHVSACQFYELDLYCYCCIFLITHGQMYVYSTYVCAYVGMCVF